MLIAASSSNQPMPLPLTRLACYDLNHCVSVPLCVSACRPATEACRSRPSCTAATTRPQATSSSTWSESVRGSPSPPRAHTPRSKQITSTHSGIAKNNEKQDTLEVTLDYCHLQNGKIVNFIMCRGLLLLHVCLEYEKCYMHKVA